MDELVSVIVPVFNVEPYIVRCINSIRNQDYDCFECILVDDGSYDSSPELCDYYVMKDARFLIVHKDNKGLSDARNTGISISTGRYISFVDSDDYIKNSFILTLLKHIKDNNAEISKTCFDTDDNIDKNEGSIILPRIYTPKMYLENIDFINGGISVCNKMFCKEMFNDISFPVGRTHEDLAIIYYIVSKASIVIEDLNKLYVVCQNPTSITRSKICVKRLDDIFFRMKMYTFLKDKGWEKAARTCADIILREIVRFSKLKPAEVQNFRNFRVCLFRYKLQFLRNIVSGEYKSIKERIKICMIILLGMLNI